VSAAGGGTAGIAGVATVITSKNEVEALLAANTEVTSDGDVTISASNDFESFALAGGAAAGGKVGIGASGAGVVVDNITLAALANGTNSTNGVRVDAAGAMTVAAAATETALTLAASGGAAGKVGIGAGAGVYVLNTTTEALVGDHARIGQGTSPASLQIEASG